MKIYFIKFQLKIFPFEINNIIAEYLCENYLNDIENCREKIFYFKNLKIPNLIQTNSIKHNGYENESIEEILHEKKIDEYNYNDFFKFNQKEIDILQHFENIMYTRRKIRVSNFLIENSGKLRYFKFFLLYKKLVKELIKSNWGLNYQIDDIKKYLIHQEYNLIIS